ncbi:glutamine synthetase/guanido kinase [Xylaria palmicola]|nr:glutamine synthetase/guanido kinase [Xylaria palmicola]
MAASRPLEQHDLLNYVLDTLPVIDQHAHPLLRSEFMSGHPLLSIVSEASGEALEHAPSSLAQIRAVKQLAQVLGCEPTWDAVASGIALKRTTSHEAWIRQCLDGIETVLVDDGLGSPEQAEAYSWHDSFTNSKCKRIVRIESVAEDIIARYCIAAKEDGIDPGGSRSEIADVIIGDFRKEVKRCIDDPEVAGFKSIICYRGGLDIKSAHEMLPTSPLDILRDIVTAHVQGKDNFLAKKRLEHGPLNHLVVRETASLISTSTARFKKPFQFHTGLGDNDITLSKSSPSFMQSFIREFPAVPIVILHAGYPWMREAAYLAAMYANVYVDIGEVFPVISRQGQENVVKQILEVCPSSKVLWSTDGHLLPETYLLANIQMRSVMKTVFGELIRTGQLDERQAVRMVQDILFTNSKNLYNLSVKTTLPNLAQLEAALAITPPQASPLARLRAMDARILRVCWHDYISSARCRLVPMKKVYESLESGKPLTISITRACFGVLQLDQLIPGMSVTGAYTMTPDWSTLKPGPVDGHVSVFAEFREPDGTAAVLCPRTRLRTTLGKAASQNLTFLVGFEVEFTVLERNAEAAGKFSPAGRDGHAWSKTSVFADWGREGSVGSAADEMLTCLADAGIDVEQLHAESAPGQFEVVLGALPPLEACDALLHARMVLESVAARHGFRMTLHPKPIAGAAGSGSHMHMSISSPAGDDPGVYEHFYAGILKHMCAIAAFTCSCEWSYARLGDSCWAGGRWVAWGTQNRETPLRKCEDSHWELKALDGIANPYLAVMAILEAGMEGVRTLTPLKWKDCAQDPAKLTKVERGRLGIETKLPDSVGQALNALRSDKGLSSLLEPAFLELYIRVKEAEREHVNSLSSGDALESFLSLY